MSVCSDSQSSKYFTSAGQHGSLSPPAFLTSRSRPRVDDVKAPSPLPVSPFMPASRFLQITPEQHAAGRKDMSPNVVEVHTHSSRVINQAVTPSAHAGPMRHSTTAKPRSRPGKASTKSEEFVLDSDESDADASARVEHTSSRSLDVPVKISVEPRDDLSRPAARSSTVSNTVASPGSAKNAMALTRRRSWTPLKDTNCDETCSNAASAMRRVVIDYHYDDGSERAPQAPHVEPLVKQCKVAEARVAKPLKVKPVKEKVPKVPKIRAVKEKVPKVPKVRAVKEKVPRAQKVKLVKEKVPKVHKVKAPKKKAMTITALATAPYQPVENSISDQVTIPEALAIVKPPGSEESTVKATTATKRKARAAVSGMAKIAKKTKIAKNIVPRLLLSPSQAQGCLAHQTFVFGTSSQLHVEESPETLKDIQLALQVSEFSPQSVQALSSPIRKSRIKVPSAPHGTCLTLEQGSRDLWCVSARDHAGSVLFDDEVGDCSERSIEAMHDASVDDATTRPVLDTVSEDVKCPSYEATPPAATEQQGQDDTNNEFVMISSDSPQPASDGPADLVDQSAAATPLVQTSPACLRPPWPSSQRAVLQPLDANRNMKINSRKTSPTFKPSRGVSAPQQTSLTQSPKRRGRPQKVNLQHEPIEITSSSPLATVQKHRSPVKATSPSQILATLHSSPPSEWHNVDEISDAEVPPTPSPPRTRQSHSPRPEPALTLACEPIAGDNTPDSKDAGYWLSASKKLFPQITSAVRAIPRSGSLTRPTWHEKILLYDPIVIEDLTAWLNAQGLRVTISKRKPKARGKKKDAGATEVAYEQTEEELAHWMVQKWCEEHSICCLWKEGLRGGVRTRY